MSSIDIDELLAKAENKQKKKLRCENHKGVERYISEVGWQTGTVAIPTYLIFYHYRSLYEGPHPTNKAAKVTFFRTFGKHFPQYRKNKQRFYLMNDGIINITEEILKVAKIYDRQHWQKKPRKKKAKVQSPGQEGNDINQT